MRRLIPALIFLLALAALPGLSRAGDMDDDSAQPPTPPDIAALENVPRTNIVPDADMGLPLNIRADAIREAALSYGARGGLAWRTWNIRSTMEKRSSYLDKVFDFGRLLIPAPSGLLIEPPIISEDINSMIIDDNGTDAAVADRIYNISAEAHIVSAARLWRNYLERDWGDVTPPPDILRPNNDKERAQWIKYVREGWEKGVEQADDIFRDDLDQMSADFQGMIRYRMLLAQGMVTPPYAMQTDRGVTGGGKKMLVGDRMIQIISKPGLVAESADTKWQPASR